MKLAQINLPVSDNEGRPLDIQHEDLADTLCAVFGGCTVTDGVGMWKDGGKLYREPVRVYQVATPNPADYHIVREIARKAGIAADQLAVFFAFDGKPEILDLRHEAPAVAA
jgi:hypothetical protein